MKTIVETDHLNLGALLTRTEEQILSLILLGMSNSEIANGLERSKRTIDAHRENIKNKIGCRSHFDYLIFAIKTKRTEIE